MAESGSPQILILPIAESFVVHKILLKNFSKGFPLTFCGNFESLLFPRTMEQRAPWKSSRSNRVQDYGRIERFGGSISFIMYNRKPSAVFLASPRCSGCRQRCSKVRGRTGPWISIVHDERDRAAKSFDSTVILDPGDLVAGR